MTRTTAARLNRIALNRHGHGALEWVVEANGLTHTSLAFRTADLEGVQRSLTVEDGAGTFALTTFPAIGASDEGEWSTVKVALHGNGERLVRIHGVVPAPVWQTSYRIWCDGGLVVLQAVALVVNATADEWEDVRLTFVSSLLPPTSPPRPPRWTGDVAEVDDGSMEREIPRSEVIQAELQRDGVGRIRRTAVASRRPSPVEGDGAGEVPPVFRREAPCLVSVPRGQAVLVPLLHQPVEGEVAVLYDEKLHPTHPLLCVRLTNTTGLALEAGPAAIFRAGEWVGESTLRALLPGDGALLPFAVESGCRVSTHFGTADEDEQEVTAGRGYLYHTIWTRSATTYSLCNTTERALTVFIEHPADRHTEYLGAVQPLSRTETRDRFITEVAPGQEHSFEVTQRRRRTETIWVTPDQIHESVGLVERHGKPELLERLRELVVISDAIAEHRRLRAEHDDEIVRISKQQGRIRKNLEALGHDGDVERQLRERYVAGLAEDEQRLQQLQTARRQEDEQVQAAKRRFKEEAARLMAGPPAAS